MISNLEELNNILFGRIEPHIYTFTTDTIPEYLKVGYTRRLVKYRIEEWRKHFPNLKEKIKNTARVGKDTFFKDFAVHQYLENDLNKKRLTEEDIAEGIYFSNEFFKDTTEKDILEAISNIKKDYETKGNKYDFYNILTALQEDKIYSSTGIWEPRDNQKRAIDAFEKAVNSGKPNLNLLMYAVMRFGKSFTAMCCAKKAKEIEAKKKKVKENEFSQFVVIVSAKKDVGDEWKKTVESAENFKDYKFLTTEHLKRDDLIIKKSLDNNKNIVLFLTLQELLGKEIKERHKQVFKQQIDLLIVDETHFGARADKLGEVLKDNYISNMEKAEKAIKTLKTKVKLHLSGTPYRILMGSEFKKEDIIAFVQYSDIVNEQKKWDKENLEALLKEDKKEWENPYYGFPQMVRFAFNPNKSSIKKLEELKKSGISYAFSELFKTKSLEEQTDDSHKIFIHEKEILELFEVIDGSKEDENLLSFLDYDKIKEGNMCRHIVCVLPYCASCDALEKLIKDNKNKFKNLCNYEIINISGINKPKQYKGDNGIKKIKDTIANYEKQDKKTITLTVNRMLTGSTVEQWDTMLYLKDTSSPQEYDQAIFRLQNPYVIKTKKDNEMDEKINMKPQTLLVDFSPNRMFKMQELKSQIYNVNVDKAGNKKLIERIKEELSISPIITINKDKIKKVNENDIIEAVINYSKNRGIAEETKDIPVDLSLMDVPEIWNRISKEREIGFNSNIEIKANDGEENDIEIPDSANEPNKDQQKTESEISDEKDNQVNPEKQFRMYYARILYFAFLTKYKVKSIDDILNSTKDINNNRIFTNLKLEKNVLFLIKKHMDKLKLSNLDYSIQRINMLSHEETLAPIKRVEVANRMFGKLGESEIVTPVNITTDMINLLPDKFFKECIENKKCILDIASKEGEFAIAIYNRFHSLGYSKNEIKNLIYSIPTSSITYEFTRKIYEILELNVDNIAYKFNCYNLLKVKDDKSNIDYNKIKLILTQNKKFSEITINDNPKIGGTDNMKFDAVVGNPPYQEESIVNSKNNKQNPRKNIFQNFQIVANNISSNKTVLIYPAIRWIHQSGKGLKEFGKNLINNKHLSEIIFYPNARDVFDNSGIADGISIVLIDKDKTTDKFLYSYIEKQEKINLERNKPGNKLLILNPKDIVFAEKIQKFVSDNNIKYLNESILPRSLFGIESDFIERNIKKVKKLDNKTFVKKNEVKILTNDKSGPSGRTQWFVIDKKLVPQGEEYISKWKVVVSSAHAGGQEGRSNQMEIIDNCSVFGRARIALKSFNDKKSATNFYRYCKSKIIRYSFLLSDEALSSLAMFVPDLVDYSNNNIINFSKDIDAQLCNKCKITKEEFKFIESMIKPME